VCFHGFDFWYISFYCNDFLIVKVWRKAGEAGEEGEAGSAQPGRLPAED